MGNFCSETEYELYYMKISAKIDYACRALLELSLHWPNQTPVPIQEIARRQKIPIKFLVHILISLKQLDFLESIRGKKGGYVLSKNPREIKLSDVIRNFGALGYSASSEKRKQKDPHVMDILWREIDRTVLNAVEQINFEMIAHRAQSKNKTIMYEI